MWLNPLWPGPKPTRNTGDMGCWWCKAPLRARHTALGPQRSNAGCGDKGRPRARFDSELKNRNSLSLFLASGFSMPLPTPRRCDKEWVWDSNNSTVSPRAAQDESQHCHGMGAPRCRGWGGALGTDTGQRNAPWGQWHHRAQTPPTVAPGPPGPSTPYAGLSTHSSGSEKQMWNPGRLPTHCFVVPPPLPYLSSRLEAADTAMGQSCPTEAAAQGSTALLCSAAAWEPQGHGRKEVSGASAHENGCEEHPPEPCPYFPPSGTKKWVTPSSGCSGLNRSQLWALWAVKKRNPCSKT